MTKVVAIELENGKVPSASKIKKKISKMIEGALNANGSWKRGWEPVLLQAYMRREEEGVYTYVHNLNRSDYSLSHNTLHGGGTFIRNMGPVSFTIETRDENQELKDLDWRFALNIIGE